METRKKTALIFVNAIFLLAADRFLKILAQHLGYDITLLGETLKFTYVENVFIAFSLPFSGRLLLVLISCMIVFLLFWFVCSIKKGERAVSGSLALIIAGAMGNLYDRLVYGYVIDYLQLKYFTVFNIADAMIVAGAFYLAWHMHNNKKMETILTKSEKETYDLGKKFAEGLSGGEILLLSGELGAGKTAFTKGLAAGLGVEDTVNSPTFVLMKVYAAKHPKIRFLVHIDAYRLEKDSDFANISAEEYVSSQDTVTAIEWPDKISKILPKKAVRIKFEHADKETRKISFK